MLVNCELIFKFSKNPLSIRLDSFTFPKISSLILLVLFFLIEFAFFFGGVLVSCLFLVISTSYVIFFS